MTTDISEREQTQEKLRASEAKYRVLVENTKEIFYSVDTEGKILFLGNQAARYGIDPEYAVSRNILEFIAPDNREEVSRGLQSKMATGDEFLAEFKVVGGDGRLHWFEEDGSVVRDVTGNITGIVGMLRDITKRKKVEEELKREKLFSETVLESLPGLFYMYDSDSHLLRWNKNHETMTGYSAEELQGRNALDLFEEDQKDLVARAMQKVFKEGEARVQADLVVKDGRKIPFDWVGYRMDLDGMSYLVGLGLDISDSVTMQNALHDNSEKLSAIIETSQDWIWAIDSHGNHTYCNPAIESILGYLPSDMVGKSSLEFLHPQDREYIESRLPELIQNKTGWQNMVLRWRHKDGNWRYLESSAVPILDAQGEIAGFRGVDRDITKRKRAEEALNSSNDLLRSVVENAPIRVFWKDSELRYLGCNTAFASDAGMSRPEDLIGKDDFQMSWRDQADLYRADDQQVMDSDTPKLNFEEPQTTPDGHTIWLRTSKVPLYDTEGRIFGMLGIYDDITALKQAEAEQEQLTAQLQQAQKMESIGGLAGGIAHDFNNILQTITGFCEILMVDMDGCIAGQPANCLSHRGDVAEIDKAARLAADLTGQLLAFSRKQPTQRREIDLNAILSDGIAMIRRGANERVRLDCQLAREPMPIHADASQMMQIAINLVSNARDAMQEGGVVALATEAVRIEPEDVAQIAHSRPGDFVCLSVSDTGVGMDANQMERLFEPFFTSKSAGKGTGLGLSVVYGIVQNHDGWINVSSTPGSGSTFRIYLPVHAGLNVHAQEALPDDGNEVKEEGLGCILLVGDDPITMEMTGEILRGVRYEVSTAATTHEAEELFARQDGAFDLLLMDVMLPEGNGIKLAEDLLQRIPSVPVLLVIGDSDEEVNIARIAKKEFHYLSKPFSLNALLGAVANSLKTGEGT